MQHYTHARGPQWYFRDTTTVSASKKHLSKLSCSLFPRNFRIKMDLSHDRHIICHIYSKPQWVLFQKDIWWFENRNSAKVIVEAKESPSTCPLRAVSDWVLFLLPSHLAKALDFLSAASSDNGPMCCSQGSLSSSTQTNLGFSVFCDLVRSTLGSWTLSNCLSANLKH